MEIKTKDPQKVIKGKKSRTQGADFEKRVRADLEARGWVVSKWQNNVEFNRDNPKNGMNGVIEYARCVPCKNLFIGKNKPIMLTGGFPDFIAFTETIECGYMIIFVECKTNNILSKKEKEKAQWYLKNNYCSEFHLAYKTKEKNRVKVNYRRIEVGI